MSIRVRRGTDTQRLSVILEEGEIAYTTDTKKFYVGDGITLGGTEIGGGTVASVTASSPLSSSGGANPNITIQDALADGSTKGAASFNASDFNASSGVISIDYTNGQSASGISKGFLTSADWTAFNNKLDPFPVGNFAELTSSVLNITGGSSSIIGAGITVEVKQSSATQGGYLSSADWSTFNGKQGSLTLTTTGTSGAATLVGNTLNIPQYSGGGGASTALNQQAAFAALGGSMVGMNISNIQLAYATTLGFTSGLLYLTTIYIPTTTTINGAKWFVAVNGSITANNYNGIGLYSYSGGTLTLVASSATDSNIWSQGTGWKSKAFSSSYSASAGVYFIGTCSSWSAATTAPNLGAVTTAPTIAYFAMDFTNSARLVCSRTSITALPSSIAMSGVNNTSLSPTIILY